MRQGVECREEDGQGWIDEWYARYKDCARYIQFCKDSTANPGFIVTPWGRMRRFIRSNYNDVNAAMERESSNFPIQSTVADAISYAIVKIQRERDLLGLRSRLILAVHDAVVMEVPYEEVKIVLELLQRCMSDELEVPGTGLHYDIETEIGLNWSDNAPEEILKLCGLDVT